MRYQLSATIKLLNRCYLLPMPKGPVATTSTTQTHLDIEDIVQDIVILKDGSACLILKFSPLTFGFLSETKQEATIFASAQLLNSLPFSIQIVVSSKQRMSPII